MRPTLNYWIACDVQRLDHRTLFGQCVDIGPATKVVGRQSEGLDVSKSA